MRILPQNLINFLHADADMRKNMLRFGFELETQETNGRRWSQRNNTENLYRSVAVNRVHEGQFTRAELIASLRARFVYWRERNIDQVIRLFNELNINNLQDLANRALVEESDILTDETPGGTLTIRHYLTRRVAERLAIDEPEIGSPNVLINDLPDLEAGHDGSVTGYEFRTLKGHDYKEISTLATRLLSENAHMIDEGCSFHIHVSLPGVFEPCPERDNLEDFQWSKGATHNTGFAAQCLSSVMNNLQRVPDDVLKRWLHERSRQYFQFAVRQDEKYTFVYLHNSGTAEFRCFGNVKTPQDATACFDLVSQAVYDALSMKYPPVLPFMAPADYESLLDGYLNNIKEELDRRINPIIAAA